MLDCKMQLGFKYVKYEKKLLCLYRGDDGDDTTTPYSQ